MRLILKIGFKTQKKLVMLEDPVRRMSIKRFYLLVRGFDLFKNKSKYNIILETYSLEMRFELTI